MSFLQSIAVGVRGQREHHNLSGDTSTTTEIGYFQPTYCRYIIPGSNVRISNRNVVRLSPVAVPTMGRIALRNYFSYVDISTLWTPFDALREGTNYRYGDGSVSTPRAVPTFRLVDFFKAALKYNATPLYGEKAFRESIVISVYQNGTLISSAGNAGTALSAVLANNPNDLPFIPYMIRQTSNAVCEKSQESSTIVKYATQRPDLNDILPIVKNSNADFSWVVRGAGTDTYHILGKFTGYSKRLRKHFIGCGYSFNPFDTSHQTFLKLFAVYKAWFDKMAINRTINFNNTNCYQLIKYLSENKPLTYAVDSTTGKDYCDIYNSTFFNSAVDNMATAFLCEIGDICYNLPPDYFSASDTTSVRGAVHGGSFNKIESIDVLNSINGDKTSYAYSTEQNPVHTQSNFLQSYGQVSINAINLAQRMLKYVNKRSVVGRKIQDLLKLNNEVDLHNNEHETVHHLGEDSTNIDINPIFSQSSTTTAELGDYAAVGYGQGQTDTYVYDSKSYGILLCLSTVVPVSGYFQGILKENGDSNRYDFFTSEYDAQGYQALAMNELVSDMQFQTASGQNVIGTDLGFFGLVPRYQHLRIGRNICNGDISIPSMQSVMLPYTFDRHFITFKAVGTSDDFAEVSLPVNAPETFRQIKANDAYGDYNRIFQYMGTDYDHFILHFRFNVDVMSPMKSVANSYDTFDSDDDKRLLFEHE